MVGKRPDVHVLPMEHFDSLATGEGSPETIRLLVDGERSRRLLLLRALLDMVSDKATTLTPLPGGEAVWRQLQLVERQSASALRTVLMHPQVGTWLSSALRLLRRGSPSSVPTWVEVGQVHAVTFAAAVRAGAAMHTRVPLRNGNALLPTLGLARFPSANEWDVAVAETSPDHTRLRYRGDEVTVPRDRTADGPGWWSLRRMSADTAVGGLTVWLDDLDPYRDLADPIPPVRLSDGDVQQWNDLLVEAWSILSQEWPSFTRAISQGVSSICPIPIDNRSTATRSASTGDAFGAVLISLPSNAPTLAVTLVHEFQHVKLGGLLHLATLHTDDDDQLFYAPWRDDPRPFGGLFQGTYAFLGITEFWRRRRMATSQHEAKLAEFEFAYARRQAWEALRQIVGTTQLTELGERFVRGMTERLRSSLHEPVSPSVSRAAWAAAAEHRAMWRTRNLRVNGDWAAKLADAWQGNERALVPDASAQFLTPTTQRFRPQDRLALFKMLLTTPEWPRRARNPHGRSYNLPFLPRDADLALVSGEAETALNGYRQLIEQDHDDVQAWAGMGLAAAVSRRTAWRPLLYRPHIVKALHQILERRHRPADPIELAEWLAR